MKKRLLSAFLAFAMVLALIPATVVPASAATATMVLDGGSPTGLTANESGKYNVTYFRSNLSGKYDSTGANITPGWYLQYTNGTKENNQLITYYFKVTNGAVGAVDTSPTNTNDVTGTWYLTAQEAVNASSSVTLIGANDAIVTNKSGLTLDTNGVSGVNVQITGNGTNILTVQDMQAYRSNTAGSAVTVTTTEAGRTGAFTLNVKYAGNVSAFTNPTTGGNTVSVDSRGQIGNIDILSTTSSSVSIKDGTAGTISMKSVGGSVTVDGLSNTGAITVAANSSTGAVPTVTVYGGTVAAIYRGKAASDGERGYITLVDPSTSASNFTINGNTAVITGNIVTHNGEVTVSDGRVNGNILVDTCGTNPANGTPTKGVTIGTTSTSATVTGTVYLGRNGAGTLAFTVSGAGNTVGTILDRAGTLALSIPESTENKFGSLEHSAGGRYGINGTKLGSAVLGGSWTTVPGTSSNPTDFLSASLTYQLQASGTYPYTFYADTRLNNALTAQASSSGTLTILYQTGATNTVTFMNGTKTLGVLLALPNSTIQVPSIINGVSVNTWTEQKDGNITGYAVAGGKDYSTPVEDSDGNGKNVVLNAQITSTGVTELTGVSIVPATNIHDITAILSGNVIKLSGTVPNSAANGTIQVNLETDFLQGGTYYSEQVWISYRISVNANGTAGTATANFGNQQLGGGMTIQDSLTVLRLSSGKTYTLDASGLKLMPAGLTVDGTPATAGTENQGTIVVTMSVNGRGWTDALKNDVKSKLENSSLFDWSESPAVKQAVNAALGNINTSQITNWRNAAQKAAYQAVYGPRSNPTTAQMAATTYTDVVMVPYLAVNVTAYDVSGTMTATLTPSYRIIVRPTTAGNAYHTALTDPNNVNTDAYGYYIASTGTALPAMTDELNWVTVQFGTAGNSLVGTNNAYYAHQDDTYVYSKPTGGSTPTYTFFHVGKTGGLGVVKFNNINPKVSLLRNSDGATRNYDTLQEAVDDTAENDVITVYDTYTGSGSINVTGKARTFYIFTEGDTLITANTGNGLINISNTGHSYVVRLTRENLASSSTNSGGNVTVASVAGGTASVSTSNAVPGQTVTITLSPNTGYASNGVTVRSSSGANVTVTGSGNSYSFTMPTDGSTVTVTPSFLAQQTRATVIVAAASRGNGTAVTSVGSNQVAAGTNVIVTTSPAAGQRTMNLTVTGATATRTGTNSFSFTVPSGYTTVTVTPQFDLDNGTLFSDVWSTDYFSAAVRWAVNHTPVVTNGNGSDYIFSPYINCTREQMITFLYRAAGQPAVTGVTNPFVDVSASEYYYNAVMWAVSKGITNGNGSLNRFGVGQTVTRAEAMTWLYRYEGSPAVSSAQIFSDVPTGQWYSKAITWAYNKGVTNGNSSTLNTYGTHQTLIRGDAMTIMYRYFTGTRA